MKQTNLSSVIGRWFVVAVPYLWLLVLFLIPFLIVLKISFAEQDIAIPPYTPLVTTDSDMGRVVLQASYLNYTDIFKDFWQSLGQILNPFHDGNGENIYLQTYWSSVKTALIVTVLCWCLAIRLPTRFRVCVKTFAMACYCSSCCRFGLHSYCVFMLGWAF